MLRTNEKRATLLAIAAHGQLTVPQIAAVSRPSPVAHYIPALAAQGYLRLAACPPGRSPYLAGTWAITPSGLRALSLAPCPMYAAP
jgi:hypothetical protein